MTFAPGFTGGALDRADHLRQDPEAYAAALGDWRARLLVLGQGYVPEVGRDGLLGWTSLADAPPASELVLLGLRQGRPHFAAITGEAGGAPFRSPALMTALEVMQPGEAATYAAARSVLDWHARHRFCANCGTHTAIYRAGWGRTCAHCKAEHFPRVDPVVIMLAEYNGHALLGRQASWPARRYSALAGFLEPGESVEEAVRREIMEEAGIACGAVRYVASQPWPFPSQLMIACVAEASGDVLELDGNELEDAIWVSRDDVRTVLAGGGGPFLAPPPYAIARTLLADWAGEG